MLNKEKPHKQTKKTNNKLGKNMCKLYHKKRFIFLRYRTLISKVD